MSGPCIRVELRGGLGNQLFQAATGFALARRLTGELEFELASFRSASLRGFGLEPFPHGARIINSPRSLSFRLLRKVSKIVPAGAWTVAPGWGGPIFEEQGYAYDDRIEALQGDHFLRGYFQSWRYFNAQKGDLLRIFNPGQVASPKAREFAAIMSPHALSIHVRAGDFLNNPVAKEVHGTLPPDYYQRAIKLACTARRVDQMLCFSDNMSVARDILRDHANVIFVEGFSQYDDMFLMSSAKSHIIANSTFSYWSAWLDGRDDSFVIAPRAWVTPRELKKTYIGDLYPADWILL
jgi:hypothetical protein